MKNINIHKYIFILVFVMLASCSGENAALEDFKKTSSAAEVNQCIGVSGSVNWQIFKPSDFENNDIRVIQATLIKGNETFEMQWLYNLNSKISELQFAGKPGEKVNRLMMGLGLGMFCLKSPENNKNTTQVNKSNANEFEFKSKSDSNEFSGAKLNSKVKDFTFGEPLQIDGGPYYFTKNKSHLFYEGFDPNASYEERGLNQKITRITFNCRKSVFSKSMGFASIDDISCDSNPNQLQSDGWRKYCSSYSFKPLEKPVDLLFIKNNSFIEVGYDDGDVQYIKKLGIGINMDFSKTHKDCAKVEFMKGEARQKGFKSLGDMLIK